MIKSRPEIRWVMFARREVTEQLVVGEVRIGLQQPGPVFIELLFNFDAIHDSPKELVTPILP